MIFRWRLPMDIEPHDFPGYKGLMKQCIRGSPARFLQASDRNFSFTKPAAWNLPGFKQIFFLTAKSIDQDL